MQDDEFGRQVLAGLNPLSIERLKVIITMTTHFLCVALVTFTPIWFFYFFFFILGKKKKSRSSQLKPALCCFILSFLQKVFPPVRKLDPSIYGSVESAFKEEHIIGHIDGMSIQQVQKMFVFPFRPSSMEVAIHNMFFLCFQILGTGREQVVHTGLS